MYMVKKLFGTLYCFLVNLELYCLQLASEHSEQNSDKPNERVLMVENILKPASNY